MQNFVGPGPLVTELWCTKFALGGMYKCENIRKSQKIDINGNSKIPEKHVEILA